VDDLRHDLPGVSGGLRYARARAEGRVIKCEVIRATRSAAGGLCPAAVCAQGCYDPTALRGHWKRKGPPDQRTQHEVDASVPPSGRLGPWVRLGSLLAQALAG